MKFQDILFPFLHFCETQTHTLFNYELIHAHTVKLKMGSVFFELVFTLLGLAYFAVLDLGEGWGDGGVMQWIFFFWTGVFRKKQQQRIEGIG